MTTGIGERLRAAREEQDRTAQAVALSLKVRTDHVLALEEEDWEVFGAEAYSRGHLRNYARELGLDPEPLLAEYDLHVSQEDRSTSGIVDGPVGTTPREPLPPWMTLAGVAALVIVGLVVVGQVFGGRTPAPAPQVTDEPVPSATATEPTPTSAPTQTATPAPVATGVDLTLDVRTDTWLRITVDGEVVQEGVLFAGTVREVVATERVLVRYGNAGGVTVELNGEDLGSPGVSGQVVELVYTPTGVVASDGDAPADGDEPDDGAPATDEPTGDA